MPPASSTASERSPVAQLLLRALLDVAPRGVGLEAAAHAAAAQPPAGHDLGVADLAGQVGGADVELAVDDDAGADAGADVDAEHVAHAARAAVERLAVGDGVEIVVQLARARRPARATGERKSTSRQPKLGALTTTPVQPRSMPAKPMPTPTRSFFGIDRAHHRADELRPPSPARWSVTVRPRHLGLDEDLPGLDVDQRRAGVGAAEIDADCAVITCPARAASASSRLSVALDLLANLVQPRLASPPRSAAPAPPACSTRAPAPSRPSTVHARAVDVDDRVAVLLRRRLEALDDAAHHLELDLVGQLVADLGRVEELGQRVDVLGERLVVPR